MTAHQSFLQMADKIAILEHLFNQKLATLLEPLPEIDDDEYNAHIPYLTSLVPMKIIIFTKRMQEIKLFLKVLRGETLSDAEGEFYLEADISRVFICEKPDMDTDAKMTFYEIIDPYITLLI